MSEIQYMDVIALDDFQDFAASTRQYDVIGDKDWSVTYAELIESEGHEFLNQHGPGALLLLPPEVGINTTSPEAEVLIDHMADELSDNLWFGFTIAENLGSSGKELAIASLEHHSGITVEPIDSFQDWQERVREHAGSIRVMTKAGLYLEDAPDELKFTNLAQNQQYVFMRTHHRLTRALDGGSHDLSPPTATELEPIADLKLAVGDYLNTLAYIADNNLGWSIEDIARYNAHKLTHRALYGKGTPTP